MKQVLSETALNSLLARVLTPPETPTDLQLRVMAAVARDDANDLEQLRGRLRSEHVRSIARLRRQFSRECVEAVILFGCIVPSVTLGVHSLSLWLTGLTGRQLPMLAEVLVLTLAGIALASLWIPLARSNALGVKVVRRTHRSTIAA